MYALIQCKTGLPITVLFLKGSRMLQFAIDQAGISNFAKGICVGKFDVTIDAEIRIRLSKSIVTELTKNNINSLWRFPALNFKGLILCPSKNKSLYVESAMQYMLSQNMKRSLENMIRSYIAPGHPVEFDKQGRISVTQSCIEISGVTSGNTMTILGTGLWYEVWHHDELIKELTPRISA